MEQSKHLNVSPYARISDTDDDRAPGIDRQLRDARTLINLRGGIPTRDYLDNDKSAYKPEVYRDDFEAWLADFQAARSDGIAGYDLDRIARQPSDLERIIHAYDEAAKQGRQVAFWTVQGSIDLSTPDGRTMARVLVAFANKSSMDTARRLASFYRHEAFNGRTYSNYPAFGWNRDGRLNEKAELLRQAAKDVLTGMRPTAIADRWREDGIVTERGKRWTGHALVQVLTAPRIAGVVVYKGQALCDEHGYIKGDWEPLLDEATWLELVAACQPTGRKRQPTRSLLGGIARCGGCGARMVRLKRTADGGRYSYTCQSKDSGGCGSVSINGNRLDVLVTELVLTLLDSQTVPTATGPFLGQSRLDEIGAKIAELMGEYRHGLPGSLVFPTVRALEDERTRLQAQAASYRRQQRTVTTVRGEWPELHIEKQRAIIKTFIQAVVIAPSGRTGKFDPGRVTVVYVE